MRLPNDEILHLHYKSDDGVTVIVECTEIVRCKDCVYNGTLFNMPICALNRMPMKPDDFCSKGKLKTQEQELENDTLRKELNKFGKEEDGLRREVDNECK